jgi:predicted amidophosphoribosyltransferase
MPRPGPAGGVAVPDGCGRCRDWPAVLSAVAATRHGGAAAAAIHGLKYRGWRHLAELCAEAMAASLSSRGVEPDVYVPVPLHSIRLRARGFNQAELLATAIARRQRRPLVLALERVRATPPQVGSGLAARRANLRGAFRALHRLAPHDTVGLIDDVATSGATLAAAAEALEAAGATRVVGVTFGLALDPHAR